MLALQNGQHVLQRPQRSKRRVKDVLGHARPAEHHAEREREGGMMEGARARVCVCVRVCGWVGNCEGECGCECECECE